MCRIYKLFPKDTCEMRSFQMAFSWFLKCSSPSAQAAFQFLSPQSLNVSTFFSGVPGCAHGLFRGKTFPSFFFPPQVFLISKNCNRPTRITPAPLYLISPARIVPCPLIFSIRGLNGPPTLQVNHPSNKYLISLPFENTDPGIPLSPSGEFPFFPSIFVSINVLAATFTCPMLGFFLSPCCM